MSRTRERPGGAGPDVPKILEQGSRPSVVPRCAAFDDEAPDGDEPGRPIDEGDLFRLFERYGPRAVMAYAEGLIEVRRDGDGGWWFRATIADDLPYDVPNACLVVDVLGLECSRCDPQEVVDDAHATA